MKTTLSNLSLIIALALGTLWTTQTTILAQDTNTVGSAKARNAQRKNQFQQVAAQLDLTDAQKQQLQPILKDEAQKLKSLRANTTLSRQQKRTQLKSAHQDFVAKIKTVLTPQQFDKWQELQATRHSKHPAKV
jgi:Spy/CpxP family protein refolding chaperone